MSDHPPTDATPAGRAPDEAPWFAEGLRFECLWPKCNACCTGDPGFVWVTPEEVEALASTLDSTAQQFLDDYCVRIDGRWSLIELANGDCVMLGEHGCRVYQNRPQQCASYPFWPEILDSPDTWQAETDYCPGINHGPLIPSEQILALRDSKPRKRPVWFEKRVMDDIREQLLERARDNAAGEADVADSDGDAE